MPRKGRQTNVRTKRSCSRARLSSGSCADKLIAPARGPAETPLQRMRSWCGRGGARVARRRRSWVRLEQYHLTAIAEGRFNGLDDPASTTRMAPAREII